MTYSEGRPVAGRSVIALWLKNPGHPVGLQSCIHPRGTCYTAPPTIAEYVIKALEALSSQPS